MKIRQGFVSNSSSSSFVLAVGKVIDRDAFDKYTEGFDAVDLFTSEQAEKLNGWHYSYRNGYLYSEGFTGASARVKIEPDSLYFVVYESCELMEDENGTVWSGECTSNQLKIFALEKQDFVANVDSTSDYGRDG